MDSRCLGQNKYGTPCSAAPAANGWCRWHDPDLADERAEWRRQGGKARSNAARAKKGLPAEPLTADEIRSHLGVVFLDVIGGRTEPGVGTAAASIARALLDVAKVAEVEQQVAQLRRDMTAFAERRGAS